MKCLLCNTDLQQTQCMNCSSDEMKVCMLVDGYGISGIWFNMEMWAIATYTVELEYREARYTLYKKLKYDYPSYSIVDHYHLSCPKLNVSNVKSFLDRILALLAWQ